PPSSVASTAWADALSRADSWCTSPHTAIAASPPRDPRHATGRRCAVLPPRTAAAVGGPVERKGRAGRSVEAQPRGAGARRRLPGPGRRAERNANDLRAETGNRKLRAQRAGGEPPVTFSAHRGPSPRTL